jgi:transposase-like protein
VNTPAFQNPGAGRRRGRYSNEFKRQVIAACRGPGVSTAAVALSNGLNANLLRRWVVESSQRSNSPKPKKASTLGLVRANPAFLPVQFESAPITQADIRIELQQGATTIRIQWPLGASSQCAAWLKEVLQ